MKRLGWFMPFIPAGLGLILALLASRHVIPNPVIYLRGHLAAVAFSLGLIAMVMLLAARFLLARVNQINIRRIQGIYSNNTKERQRFLQRLDHELKNPLTAIQTGLSNLTDVLEQDYSLKEVEAIASQTERIGRLISDLRKLATLETASLNVSKVDMNDLLAAEVEATQEETGRSISLVLPKAPWPLPRIVGDEDLLLLAVHNLLDNAIKFSDPSDTIEVRASDDGQQIVVEVADTGKGIPEDDFDSVWKELFRGQEAHGVAGSGIGLALVKVVVEKHGGTVGLRSEEKRGTVVSMCLPIKAAPAVRVHGSSA
jgi:two-component system OmpR family sensor kinase